MRRIASLFGFKRMQKVKVSHLLVMNLFALAIILIAEPAFANYWNGGTRGYSGCTGAAATIETANPTVVTNGSSSAWAAVIGSNTG